MDRNEEYCAGCGRTLGMITEDELNQEYPVIKFYDGSRGHACSECLDDEGYEIEGEDAK